LNEHLFRNLAAARRIIEAWRINYNHTRLHTSLNGLTPAVLQTTASSGIRIQDSDYEPVHVGSRIIMHKPWYR
jgi:hypothetical protein